MKQIKTLLIAALFISDKSDNYAQAKQLTYVSEIMAKMPAMLDAQKQLEKLSGTYDSDYKKMVEEYQAKLKKYEAESATVTDVINGDRSKEVQDMQKKLLISEIMLKKITTKESDIVNPLMAKVRASIKKVATKFQYVLDGSTLLLADGPNLT
jgi:outer membrane protein